MAKNYVNTGKVVNVTAPYATASGQGVLVGALFGIALHDAANAKPVDIMTEGRFTIGKTSALAIGVGDRVYWDDTNRVVNKTATGQYHVGIAVSAAANPSSTVDVILERGPALGA